NKEQGSKLQGDGGDPPTVIAIHSMQQLAKSPGICDGGVVADSRRFEQPAQVLRDVTREISQPDRMPKDSATTLIGAAGPWKQSLDLNIFQYRQQLKRSDCRDGPVAQPREDVPFQKTSGVDRRIARQLLLLDPYL